MSREYFYKACDMIYEAIRKAYGYGEVADELIDKFDEMADAWLDIEEGAELKVKE